jgi:4-amino-4-deoxy-L-arabinose transferase-like glycosyltransferase
MHEDPERSWLWRHRDFILLAVAAAALFTANMSRLSLLPLDDCFYARKGVEMAERGPSFTVTWKHSPNYQNPPMQFWLLGASFALFGENDFAARLPSVLMALALLCAAYRIGHAILGRESALAGVGLLLLVPMFAQNARRCMLEMPTAFWVTLCFWLVLESRRRRRLGLWVAVPLAAACLTKSLLGLLPLAVVGAFTLHPDGRRLLANPWLVLGLLLGLAGAATWPLHQGFTAGWRVVQAHYAGEIGGRALDGFSLRSAVTEYPKLLLQYFQPVVLPGLVGAFAALRRGREGKRLLLAIWVLLPLLLYNFASVRSARYLFPTLVPLALLGGDWALSWKRRTTRVAATRVAPALLLVLAAIYWIRPLTLTRDLNAPFKRSGRAIEELVPEGSDLPLFAESASWRLINPLLYYAHRGVVARGEASLQPVLEMAGELPTPAFVAPREQLETIRSRGVDVSVFAELGRWLVLLPEDDHRSRAEQMGEATSSEVENLRPDVLSVGAHVEHN